MKNLFACLKTITKSPLRLASYIVTTDFSISIYFLGLWGLFPDSSITLCFWVDHSSSWSLPHTELKGTISSHILQTLICDPRQLSSILLECCCPTLPIATDVLSLLKLFLFSFTIHFPCSFVFLFAIRFSTRIEWCWLLKLAGVVMATKWIIVAQNNNLPISWLQLLWIWSNPSFWAITQWIDHVVSWNMSLIWQLSCTI